MTSEHELSFTLGKSDLGVNTVTGGDEMESHKQLRFIIGPLKNTRVEDFLEGAKISRFLDCFTSYFLPVEVDASWEIVTERNSEGFTLGQENNHPIMGYNTII